MVSDCEDQALVMCGWLYDLEINKLVPRMPTIFLSLLPFAPPSSRPTRVMKLSLEDKSKEERFYTSTFLIPFPYIQGLLSLHFLYSIITPREMK
jgi:hypothetical protein